MIIPRHPALLAACEKGWAGDGDVFTHRLADGAEVARVGLTLLVAEPDGRVLRQDDIPRDVSVKVLVERLMGMRRAT